jgi:hypothetical protein
MLFLFIKFANVQKLRKTLIMNSIVMIVVAFFLFDYLFMGGAYFDQISKTFDSEILYELKFYLSLLKPENVLFGIELLKTDDPFDGSNYSIPIIDVGVFNILIQYGIVGVIFIYFSYCYLYKIIDGNGKKFLIVNLFSLIHYFNIISFACLLATYFVFYKEKKI